MIKHIVLWKLKSEALGNKSNENALLMKEKLEAMPAKIEELQSATVGIHMFENKGDEAICDVCLIAECKNEADLKAYAAHPAHLEVVDFIKQVVSERRVIDIQ